MQIISDYNIQSRTSFGIAAQVKHFCSVGTLDDLRDLCRHPVFTDGPHLFLGGGCNLLFLDAYPGCVVAMDIEGIDLISESDEWVFVRACAGEDWPAFVDYCCAQGWNGLENLADIPGRVGAAPVQNIGAYGRELKDVVFSVEAYNWGEERVEIFTPEKCRFGYRDSIFKHEAKEHYAILSVTFRLSKKAHFHLSYGALQEAIARDYPSPTATDVATVVKAIRSSKLPDPKVLGNAGSFFKNPTISQEHYEQLRQHFPSLVAYPAPKGMKVGAAWLIENGGWKGFRRGDAGVHEKQALVLVNYGSASGQDIRQLADDIIDSVFQKFQIQLHPEVNYIQ